MPTRPCLVRFVLLPTPLQLFRHVIPATLVTPLAAHEDKYGGDYQVNPPPRLERRLSTQPSAADDEPDNDSGPYKLPDLRNEAIVSHTSSSSSFYKKISILYAICQVHVMVQ